MFKLFFLSRLFFNQFSTRNAKFIGKIFPRYKYDRNFKRTFFLETRKVFAISMQKESLARFTYYITAPYRVRLSRANFSSVSPRGILLRFRWNNTVQGTDGNSVVVRTALTALLLPTIRGEARVEFTSRRARRKRMTSIFSKERV